MKQSAAFQQEEIDTGAEIVCVSLETHSAKETMQLGAVFANVARLDARPADFPHKIMRVGLMADSGSGKTTFAQGFNELFMAGTKNIVMGAYGQSFRETSEAGLVRSVDANISAKYRFPAYFGGWTEMQGEDGVDLIEHPSVDCHGRNEVDYLVMLHSESGCYNRKIEILCLESKARSKGFQAFLQAANGNVEPIAKARSDYSGDVLRLLR